MTEQRTLAQIREMCEKATPGEWEADGLGSDGYLVRLADVKPRQLYERIAMVSFQPWSQLVANAAFIAAARTELPRLLGVLEGLVADGMSYCRSFETVLRDGKDCEDCRDSDSCWYQIIAAKLREAGIRP